ncbi:MAG TPA: hypothetical protein VFE13_09565 [Caulobacteraceae bacterium]|nr:hypothetical protein [Caulobacteraceae bacterium]
MVATSRKPDGTIRVIVAPITHRQPDDSDASTELPNATCRALRLDAGRHWLRFEELNSFSWPGFDLRPIPGRGGEVAYGMLPQSVFEVLRKGILLRQASRKVRLQQR